jgi:exosortase
MIGMLYLLYFRLGTVWVSSKVEQAAIPWIVSRWRTGDVTFGLVYYLLGWSTPLISGWLVWRDRWELLAAPKRRSWMGLVLIAGCLLAHWAGVKSEHLRLSALSLIGLTWSIPLFLYGWAVARRLLFPCAYLIVCIPLNFLDGLAFRGQVLTARITATVLSGMGLPCIRRGTTLLSTEDGGFVLVFQSPADGFGMLLLCMMAAALYGYLGQRGWVRRTLVFLGGGAVFAAANVTVMTGYGLLAAALGQGVVDRMGGRVLTVLLLAVAALYLWGWATLVRVDWRARIAGWKRSLVSHSGPSG